MVWAAARHQWGVVKLMKVAGVRSGGLFLFQLLRLAYPDVLNTSRAHRGQLGAQKGEMYAARAQRVASNRTRTGGRGSPALSRFATHGRWTGSLS